MNKIAGNGLKPSDIIDTPDGSQGPPEVRYRAHVAFSTVYDTLKSLEQVHNRRKAFIYVSEGYVRAIPHFRRTLRSVRRVDDVGRLQPVVRRFELPSAFHVLPTFEPPGWKTRAPLARPSQSTPASSPSATTAELRSGR